MNLKLSEKKILSTLEIDSRIPANQIAKKLKFSTEGVIKIINRLTERKIIRKFNTKINYSKMGYHLYPVHIKLMKRDGHSVKKIISIIKKYRACVWHIFCEGEYDLLLSFSIKDEKDKK
jgi:DNA-binding Lrp family transcriptional regulator